MLSKILKYDFKSIFQYYIPISIFIVLYAIAGRLIVNFDSFANNIDDMSPVLLLIKSGVTFIFVLSLIAYGVISVLLVVMNFYKKMVTDQGYLSHTLPTSTLSLIMSKLICSVVISILTSVIIFSSAVIFFGIFKDIPSYIDQVFRFVNTVPGWSNGYIVTVVILALLSMVEQFCMLFLSIALGQFYTKHRVIGAILAYMGLTFIKQTISTIVSLPMMLMSRTHLQTLESMGQFNLVMGVSTVISIAFIITELGITHYVFKNKLNLQ